MTPKPEEKVQVPVVEEQPEGVVLKKEFDKDAWKPKTEIGKRVKAGEILDINQILDNGQRILEHEIVMLLLPNMESDLIMVGQSKGKFGGGKRSIWKQTQKKTQEGNKPKFSTLAVVGNKDGYVGMGKGKSKETLPAREKALRNARLNIIKVTRGCGSWACSCSSPHSIPFKVEGRCSGAQITLMPAPKGTGLCVEKECKKLLALAGIKDIYSKTYGNTKVKLNLIKACYEALKKLSTTYTTEEFRKSAGITEGRLSK